MWYVPKCCPVPVYAISSSCSFSYSITFRLNSIKSVRIQALGRVMGLGLGVLCDYPQVYFGSFGSSIFALEKCIGVCPFWVGFSTDLHWLRSKLVHPCWLVMCNYSCLLHIFMIAMIAVAYRNKQSLWQLLMWQEHLWLILNGLNQLFTFILHKYLSYVVSAFFSSSGSKYSTNIPTPLIKTEHYISSFAGGNGETASSPSRKWSFLFAFL